MELTLEHLEADIEQQNNALGEPTILNSEAFSKTSAEVVPLPHLLTRQEHEDKLLVSQVIAGTKCAEDKLAIKFRPMIYAMLIKLTGDPIRAEDLTHETLILILQKLRAEQINKPEKLTSFIFSTAKFSFLGWLRKKDNQVELMDSMGELVCEQDSPEDECLAMENTVLLESLIEGLTVSRDREILTRRYIRDQSKKEICDALVLSQQHYDRVISRAKGRLRDCVEVAA